jgi:hypothetical protein
MVGRPCRGSRSVRVFATSYSQSKHPDEGDKGASQGCSAKTLCQQSISVWLLIYEGWAFILHSASFG